MNGHQPNFTVLRISAFLARWWVLSPERLASAVRPRPSGAACAPDLAMELALVAEAEAGGR